MISSATSNSAHGRFLRVAIGTLLGGIALVVALSYYADPYGLFGRSPGTGRVAYRDERTTKYLFAYEYIPKNFNGLLIGSSISANWNTERISGIRVYNASISGGNLFEERLIADRVLDQKALDWLVIALHPYLTMTNGRRTEAMTPRDYWSAFGSLNVLLLQSSKLLSDWHIVGTRHNEYGDSNNDEGLAPAVSRGLMNAYIAERRRTGLPAHTFSVAPGGMAELTALVQRAKERGTRLLIVYPPVYRGRFEVEQADWEAYWHQVNALLPSDSLQLNFNTAEFDTLRGDLGSFQDTGHLSRACADRVVDEIARTLATARPEARETKVGAGRR